MGSAVSIRLREALGGASKHRAALTRASARRLLAGRAARLALALALVVGLLAPTSRPARAEDAPRPRVVFFLSGVNSSSSDLDFAALQAYLEQHGAADGWADPARTTYQRFSYAYPPSLEYTCRDTWRGSLVDYARRLELQVADYVAGHPDSDIILIGHSQGGLIAFVYLALLKQSLHAAWREPAPGTGARLTHIATLHAPLGGIPPAAGILGDLGSQAGGVACQTLTLNPPNTQDMRAIWPTAQGEHPRGAAASVAQALLPDRYGVAEGVRYANQQLAIDAGFASMRTLTIGSDADWVWSPCGPVAETLPPFLDTQWLVDMPTAGVYSRVVSPDGALACVAWADIPANHSAALADPTAHAAILSFLNGDAPDQLAPAPPEALAP
jgi:pimeloyl-ACP methyl ester carboxylesterase